MSKNRQTGMTLIEILVVVLVVSVGMAATAKFQGELLQSGATTKARTQALSHAQNAVEALRIDHGNAADGSEEDIAGSSAEYQLAWSVNDFADAKQYTATVGWVGADGQSESVKLDTVLYADIMLSGDDTSDEDRGDAAECVFLLEGCGVTGTNNTPPDVTVIINTSDETRIEDSDAGNNSVASGLNADDLSELGRHDNTLTGSDKVDSPKGSADYQGTAGNDKFLITGNANSVSVDMGNGDDILQITDDELNGSTDIQLGAGDDLFIVGDIGNSNSQSFDGGSGIDTICFSEWSESDYEGFSRKSAISNFEILLFNDGYQFANGYTTDEANIPVGCGGSGGSSSFVYQYPVTVELVFSTEESAGRDDVALVKNNTGSLTIIENDNLIYNQDLDVYDLYLHDIAAEEGTGDNAGKFVKEVTFTLESPDQISDPDSIKGCTSWEGDNFSELEITLQESACE